MPLVKEINSQYKLGISIPPKVGDSKGEHRHLTIMRSSLSLELQPENYSVQSALRCHKPIPIYKDRLGRTNSHDEDVAKTFRHEPKNKCFPPN
jgi:hypothetical protein